VVGKLFLQSEKVGKLDNDVCHDLGFVNGDIGFLFRHRLGLGGWR